MRIKKFLTLLIMLIFTLSIVYAGGKKETAKGDDLDLAIRDASDYLNGTIPEKSKIVILNIESDSFALSEYIIDELIANAINDRVFSVVDRQQLDAIRAEQNFQFSGEVDDKQALEIGKFLGAQTIVSGSVNSLGSGHRLRIRALEVQTALVQGQFNRNINSSSLIKTLIGEKSSTGSSNLANRTQGNRQTTVTIVNNTGIQNERVFYYEVTNNIRSSEISWLEGTTIANAASKTVSLSNLDTNKKYTIGIRDNNPEGNVYRKDNITVSPNMTITFTTADLLRRLN